MKTRIKFPTDWHASMQRFPNQDMYAMHIWRYTSEHNTEWITGDGIVKVRWKKGTEFDVDRHSRLAGKINGQQLKSGNLGSLIAPIRKAFPKKEDANIALAELFEKECHFLAQEAKMLDQIAIKLRTP